LIAASGREASKNETTAPPLDERAVYVTIACRSPIEPGQRRKHAPRAVAGPSYARRMCIICVELAKQSMTPSDARRALREMTDKLERGHVAEVEAKAREAEDRKP
jgi:hypothetical protein